MGVIQGSKTGPLLFDIFSSDFVRLNEGDDTILYADDTCLVFVGIDISELFTHVNNRLGSINVWCSYNKLSINPAKSEYMVVSNRTFNPSSALVIGTEPVKRVDCFKYLGMHVDRSLKFNTQVDALKAKLSQLCGIAYRLRKFMNLQSAKNFYFSCVQSSLNYCLAVWGGCCGRHSVALGFIVFRIELSRTYLEVFLEIGVYLKLRIS